MGPTRAQRCLESVAKGSVCLGPPPRLLGPQKGLSGWPQRGGQARPGVGGPICRCWALSTAALDVSTCPSSGVASHGGRRAPSSGSQCSLQRRSQSPPHPDRSTPLRRKRTPSPSRPGTGYLLSLHQVLALVLPLSLLPLQLCCTPMDFALCNILSLLILNTFPLKNRDSR